MAGFPYPATTGDTYTVGDYTWRYDGVAWVGAGLTAGPAGPIGAQGLQGIQGLQGSTGIQGSQGPPGAGDEGSQGIQGIQGLQGTTGTQGLQGTTGSQGITGTQGLQGSTGTQGLQGSTGTQGLQGSTGTQGLQGTTGSQGTTGTQGLQGTTGSQGTTGTQGLQGSTGTQGTTGTQGLQGTIGNYGFNSGIFSKYHSIDGWTLGFNCGADEDGIFFFSACPGDCESGTCLGQYPTNIGLYIQTEEHFGGDLVGYFQNLYNNALGNGYWFIRYYTSDPSQASVLTTFISDNVDYPINIGGYDFIRFNGGICGPLPIDETIYSLSYYPYVP
jgi:hypothetical protein